MLLSYDDFRPFFEARGIAEADGRAQLELYETLLDPFVIKALEGFALGKSDDLGSDLPAIAIESQHSHTQNFNGAAHDEAAGKKET